MSNSLTRRRLLHHGAIGTSTAVAFSLLPRPLTAMLGGPRPEPIPPIQDDRIKALVQQGLDAAKAAGATYADIRMTHTRERRYGSGYANPAEESEMLHVGVRALVNGYWGIATSTLWSPEEIVRLGREAARQAKVNASGLPREVVFPQSAVVRNGHWETPVEIDPFVYHPNEIGDYLHSINEQSRLMLLRMDGFTIGTIASGSSFYNILLQSKAIGSTDGSYCTQRLFRSEGGAWARSGPPGGKEYTGSMMLTPTAAGWELFRNAPILDLIQINIRHNLEIARLPVKPIEVDKYATVLDAQSVANLLSQTIGTATQLDRSLGYEANSGGTSYLSDPEEMLGTYKVGNELLTVTANRNERGGLASVGWDDEATAPTTFTLVDQGVISDFQTSREGAGWLKPAYDRLNRPFQSNGCAYSETGTDVPTIHTPNLAMQPATTGVSYKDLEAGIEKGISIVNLTPIMDFQAINGYSSGFECCQIEKGKRVARVYGAGTLFRTPELWKAITAIGGSSSQVRYGLSAEKGQPRVIGYHSVTAVPVALKELTFIDSTQRG